MPPRHAYWTILIDDQPTAFRAHDPEELVATLNRLKEKQPTAVMKWFERGKLWDSRDAARLEGFGQGERRWEGERPARDSDPARGDESAPRRDARKGAGSTKPDELRGRDWRPGGEHRDPRQKYKDAKKAKWGRFKQQVRSKWEARQERKIEPPPPDRSRDEERPAPPPATPERKRPHGSYGDRPRDDRRQDFKSAGGWKPKGPPRARPPRDRDDSRGGDARFRDDNRDRDLNTRGRDDTRFRDDRRGPENRFRDDNRDRDTRDREPRARDTRDRDTRGRDDNRFGDRPRDEGRRDFKGGGFKDGGWKPKGPPRDDRRRFQKPGATKPYGFDKSGGSGRGPKPAGARKPHGQKPWQGKTGGQRPKPGGKSFGSSGPRRRPDDDRRRGPGGPPGPKKPRSEDE